MRHSQTGEPCPFYPSIAGFSRFQKLTRNLHGTRQDKNRRRKRLEFTGLTSNGSHDISPHKNRRIVRQAEKAVLWQMPDAFGGVTRILYPANTSSQRDFGSVIMFYMTDVTQILDAIQKGDPSAADQLLPLVYEELRALARQRLANEKPGQTLQATALVHEAYLRLVGKDDDQSWDNRGHFFAAAAEAMRRILVEAARQKNSLKKGGGWKRQPLSIQEIAEIDEPSRLLAIDEALTRLDRENPSVARLIELRYFAGFSQEQAASVIGVSTRTAQRYWTYAKAWLLEELTVAGESPLQSQDQ